jgi:hypothetical protein
MSTVPIDYANEDACVEYTLEYKRCPVRVCWGADNRVAYLDITDLLQAWQRFHGMGMRHTQPFPLQDVIVTLSPDYLQIALHRALQDARFDFFHFPLKLQRWNPATEKWDMLPIDFLLMTAAFLVYRNKAGREFQDDVHPPHQRLAFRTEQMPEDRTRTLITPVLGGEYLRLKVSHEITPLLANLRFSAPAVMATAAADFSCNICLGEGHSEKVFMTGCDCGHGFHKECIYQWFATGKSSCPVCRKAIRHGVL